MRRKHIYPLLVFYIFCTCLIAQNDGFKKVQYFDGTIVDVNNDFIEFLDGSKWLTNYSTLLLPFTDVIIIYNIIEKTGVLYTDGNEISVKHIVGEILLKTGYLTKVIQEYGDGAILITEDGSKWEIPEYDRYDTGYWLPPYTVLITSNELFLYNLEELKKIWINRIK